MKESQHGDIVLMRRVHEDGIAYFQIPCIANAFLGGYSVVEFCEYGVRMGGRCRASMSVSATEQHSAFAIGKLCVEISGWIQRERVGLFGVLFSCTAKEKRFAPCCADTNNCQLDCKLL